MIMRPLNRLDADAFAFALLGISVSWTLSDAVFANLATFMRCLPAGLYLPDQIGILSNMLQTIAILVWWAFTYAFGLPSFRSHVILIWACLAVELSGAIVLAIGWRVTIGDASVVMLSVESLATVIGALSWAATLPFISTHFAERLVSAFFTGSASGSLIAGLLGLAQGAAPAFSPRACFTALFVLLAPSVWAWRWILLRVPRKTVVASNGAQEQRVGGAADAAAAHGSSSGGSGGVGQGSYSSGGGGSAPNLRPPDAEAKALAPPMADSSVFSLAAPASHATSPAPKAASGGPARSSESVVESGQIEVLQRQSRGWAWWLRLPDWMWTSLPAWSIAVPMNMATWGVSPNISNFAATHAVSGAAPSSQMKLAMYLYRSSIAAANSRAPSNLATCHRAARARQRTPP